MYSNNLVPFESWQTSPTPTKLQDALSEAVRLLNQHNQHIDIEWFNHITTAHKGGKVTVTVRCFCNGKQYGVATKKFDILKDDIQLGVYRTCSPTELVDLGFDFTY